MAHGRRAQHTDTDDRSGLEAAPRGGCAARAVPGGGRRGHRRRRGGGRRPGGGRAARRAHARVHLPDALDR
ncbi:hypothetical protein FNJ62_10125 [Streptomyces benahoarensis]|uniref:Uncharacterized protein n=1 Tax=Streptomyces benahoarensis TaxID=2595054 RepID=A0A553ZJM6_9ACTN|nr:hypothetical protein FNJ62_10125 [Streptomyces benahoarensis]TSB41546.1 hypothetical protein FNZ23_12480 [Streptomyces benahoarensis]